MSEQKSREKFYTVSARMVFSSIMVLIIVGLILGISTVVNKGPINPILGIIPIGALIGGSGTSNNIITNGYPGGSAAPIVVAVSCSPTNTSFACQNPYFNYTTGMFTVALSQKTGYSWIQVTVRFVPVGTVYSHGVPELSWAPPQAVNVSGGLLSNTTKYVNIPISSGPVAVGTNITGSIWAKYQLGEGKAQFYANMSSAIIEVKQ